MTRADPNYGRAATSGIVVVGLLVLMTVALRGHVPGVESPVRERSGDNPVALVLVAGLLAASVAVVALAVVTRLRHRTARPAPVAARSDWLRAERGRPTWRLALVVSAGVLGLVLIVMLLSRLQLIVPTDPPAAPVPAPDATPEPLPAADVPTDPGPAAEPSEWNLLGYFYVATAAFLLILVAGTIIAARQRNRAPTMAPDAQFDDRPVAAPTPSDSLARAAEVGLAEVGDLSREPRTAIIACYAAMEGELARVPGAAPQDFDTASEVLARAVERRALQPDSATELVDLFEEARFSPHVMNEEHRETAVGALQRVLAELGART